MRSSDWSSDVCSSDLFFHGAALAGPEPLRFSVRTKPQSHKNFLKYVRPELVEGPLFLWALRKSGASTSSAQTGINKDIFFVASWRRSEERRVGKECVRSGRFRGSSYY